MTAPPLDGWPHAAIPELGVADEAGGRIVTARRGGDLVEIRTVVPTLRAGLAVGSAERALLAAAVGRRTAGLDPDQLGAAFAACGADFTVTSGTGYLQLRAFARPDRAADAVALIGETLTRPDYQPADVAAAARTLAAELRRRSTVGSLVLDDAILRLTFTGSELADQPNAQLIESVTAAGLRSAHDSCLGPVGCIWVFAGDVDAARLGAAVSAVQDGWTGLPTTEPAGSTVPAGPALLIDRPGAVQASIGMVGAAPGRGAPDYPALAAAIRIVGGTATSRVSVRLRERRGWAYFANVYHRGYAGRSTVVATTAVATEFAAAAVNELHYELGRAGTQALSVEEIADGARGLAGRLAVNVHTAAGLADDLAELAAEQAPLDAGATLNPRLAQVTADGILAVAQRYLAPRHLRTVVVGDAERIEPALSALLPVTVVPS